MGRQLYDLRGAGTGGHGCCLQQAHAMSQHSTRAPSTGSSAWALSSSLRTSCFGVPQTWTQAAGSALATPNSRAGFRAPAAARARLDEAGGSRGRCPDFWLLWDWVVAGTGLAERRHQDTARPVGQTRQHSQNIIRELLLVSRLPRTGQHMLEYSSPSSPLESSPQDAAC